MGNDASDEMRLLLDLTYLDVVNYAIVHNKVPLIQKLVIHSTFDKELAGIELQISSTPAFILPFSIRIDSIPPERPLEVTHVNIMPDGDYLAAISEKVIGHLHVRLMQGEQELFANQYPIELQAFDEWSGAHTAPEILASFVTPNDPATAGILQRAAELMRQWTPSGALNAYQTGDTNRVRLIAAAIFHAIKEWQITYVVPPASFEKDGQRIRLADTVFSNRMATCLDFSVLFASCLEAAGMNPLIAVVDGHAFGGLWLTDETFPEAVQYDPSALTKRVSKGLSTICLVECTALACDAGYEFEAAEVLGRQHLDKPEEFLYVVDIKRARMAGILPLPTRAVVNGRYVVEKTVTTSEYAAPSSLAPDLITDNIAGPRTRSRFDTWERKLLDLGMRNGLLNFRKGRSGVPLLCADLDDIEDAFAQGKEFAVLSKPAEIQNDVKATSLLQQGTISQDVRVFLQEEFRQNRLRSLFGDEELNKSMIHLYRKSREALEENGANVLYLAIGFLTWYESTTNQVPRYAPIILVPVEIIRKSAKVGYVIRARDDESRMNITLLEMLKKDFSIEIGGLDPLPADESGIDTRLILTKLRQAVMGMPRWDILEETSVGLFSFNRFVMWNDIHSRRKELEGNKVVQSLISGRVTWDTGSFDRESDGTGEVQEFNPCEILLSDNADASQLEAISAAGKGQTFVLHGPPGTGKSQTITNIISNALAHHQTVLFVAEKMAALSVVRERMRKLGLDAFCLELHSNKATKKSVLEQLNRAIETERVRVPENYQEEAEELKREREELNTYVRSLYRKWPFGLTLYDALSMYSRLEKSKPSIFFAQESFAAYDTNSIKRIHEIADQLVIAAEPVFPAGQHPLKEIGCTQYSFDLRDKAAARLGELSRAAAECDHAFRTVSAQQTLPMDDAGPEYLAKLAKVSSLMRKGMSVPAVYLNSRSVTTSLGSDVTLLGHCIKARNLRRTVRDSFAESVFSATPEGLSLRWKTAGTKWLLPRLLEQSGVKKSLKAHLLPAVKLNDVLAEQTVQILDQIKAEEKAYQPYLSRLSLLAGQLWQEEGTEWEKVEEICRHAASLEAEILSCSRNSGTVDALLRFAARDLESGRYESLTPYETAHGKFTQEIARTNELLRIDVGQLQCLPGTSFAAAVGQMAARQLENLGRLREWCQWQSVCETADTNGMNMLVQLLAEGKTKIDDCRSAFFRAFYRASISYIFSQDPGIVQFSGLSYENQIRKLRVRTQHHRDLVRRETFARVSSILPDKAVEAAQSSEVGILKRAIRSNGRSMSIRSLFNQIPNVLTRLCPCLLMSPISVAQYLDPRTKPFDIVIFDEASQVPTSEAVGAIARGANAIIVGDPKQLPPTSFFAADATDEEFPEMEDLDSILDDCLALSVPELHLKWHYRSRHESLIAFSNTKFYENKLYTFPSPQNLVSRVHYVQVPGYYDRGGTRQNEAEGRAVVAEIARRLTDPELRTMSIGVVTFSSVQQTLIDDLLQAEFLKNPMLEEFSGACAEPIIIKNLENVQGDERDVILFSVGYGPDKTGRMHHDFGPLNREGGWRRLNVAVSRARNEMIVFSTLMPEQIDLNRTMSEGVRGLKDFLIFAQKGNSGIVYTMDRMETGKRSLNTIIADRLVAVGLTAHADVGSSNYKVDVAIVHPERPDEYILGLLCNGSSYRSAKTISDREILLPAVLEQLGWNLTNVWAVDWLDDTEKECNRIKALVDQLVAEGENSKSHTGLTAPSTHSTETISIASLNEMKNVSTTSCANRSEPIVKEKVTCIREGFVPLQAGASSDGTSSYRITKKRYVAATLMMENVSADELCMLRPMEQVTSKMMQVIRQEGPITQKLLFRRVLQSYGLARLGSRLEEHFHVALKKIQFKVTRQGDVCVIWPIETVNHSIDYFRYSPDGEGKRNAEDVPVQEYVAVAVYVLERQFSMNREDLMREIAKEFGYSRMGTNVIASIQAGLELAVQSKKIVIHSELVELGE